MVYGILVGGPSGGGKTTFLTIATYLLSDSGFQVAPISTDDFYRDFRYMSEHERDDMCFNPDLNWDVPQSVDYDGLVGVLDEVIAGRGVSYPQYDFAHHCPGKSMREIAPGTDIFIVEGNLALYSGVCVGRQLLDRSNCRYFITARDEVVKRRRIERDVNDPTRKRERAHAERHYEATVEPGKKMFVDPSAANASKGCIIVWDTDNMTEMEALPALVELTRERLRPVYADLRSERRLKRARVPMDELAKKVRFYDRLLGDVAYESAAATTAL